MRNGRGHLVNNSVIKPAQMDLGHGTAASTVTGRVKCGHSMRLRTYENREDALQSLAPDASDDHGLVILLDPSLSSWVCKQSRSMSSVNRSLLASSLAMFIISSAKSSMSSRHWTTRMWSRCGIRFHALGGDWHEHSIDLAHDEGMKSK